MAESSQKALLTINESMFYRLLEGPGEVQVDMVMIDRYFLPFVSYRDCAEQAQRRFGLILRNGTDLLAAETADDLIRLLRDMAGMRGSLKIRRPVPPSRSFTARAWGLTLPW
ncbi:hypothetical protein [Pseudoduganella namucuonensis]|uniref:Uncharacterized protein n=1 Tax=Pseudoduganella namucuonensis TaxID=1035707 RepID=A0A1I7M7Y0_9BURK|nr:hypothetical protein [Pseudoduganella namucuonensis]SFV18038.1 hypothetical protein SAMN05216552_10875 [Pseudoduganella namucuonensis]